jgi:uncharacterized protein (DUF697 family)/uncharacterized membrane protein YebE (DUF533 family)
VALAPGHIPRMPIQANPLTEQEHRAIIGVCILAAFADGAQSEAERARVEQILHGFTSEHLDLTSLYQDVLGGQFSLTDAASQLQTPASKALAYEMAVCVCNVDGVLQDPEREFLAELRQALQLDAASGDAHLQSAQAIVAQPLSGPVPPAIDSAREAELDRMILNAAILNGALEIIPHTLATMAIVPLQMRLVYQIGSRYGFTLDRGHITDFLATVGIGLTSQVFEGFTRRLFGGLARPLAGRLLGGLVGEAAGSAFGFATTYALGQVARRYYASGRTLNAAQLKDAFASLLRDARSLQGRYSGDIVAKSREVNVAELLPLARQQ